MSFSDDDNSNLPAIHDRPPLPVAFESDHLIRYEDKLTNLADALSLVMSELNNGYDYDTIQSMIRVISELNKMQGHYAVKKSQSVKVNVNATLNKIKDVKKTYEDY